MSERIQKFWMVYGIGQRAPTFRHATKLGAIKEAQRLASCHFGIEFFVLSAVEGYRRPPSALERLEVVLKGPSTSIADDDGIPF